MRPSDHPQRPTRLTVSILLVLIVLAGGWLRFSHLNWDGLNQLHPDERAILFVASQMTTPVGWRDVLNPAQSSLNPFRSPMGEARLYPYGHLPLYATVLSAHLLSPTKPTFNEFTIAGRALSAAYDTGSIIATFLLARRLFHRWAGLVAAACAAVAVLHVQNAHFGTVDAALSLFVTLALWLLVAYASTPSRRDALLAGVCVGLAIGCKVTAGMLILPLLIAHHHLTFEDKGPIGGRVRASPIDMPALWLSLLAAGCTFALTNPYAVLDPLPYLTSVSTQAQVISGGADWPFTRQYLGTLPILYYIEQQARWTLGFPLTLASYAALIWAARRAYRDGLRPVWLVLVWIGIMLLTVGTQLVKFPRYLLPISPALFALLGGMLTSGIEKHGTRVTQSAILAILLVPTAAYAMAFAQMYRFPHPWVAASEWIYLHLPPGTRIVSERWDDPLPLDLPLDGQWLLRETHIQTRLIDPFAEPDDLTKITRLLTEVAASDFIILSSNRLYGVIPRLEDRYPFTAAYYHALFSGDLGFTLDRTFSRYPNLLGASLLDDPFIWPRLPDPRPRVPPRSIILGPADESFTVYDHPLVLVFRNRLHLSREQLLTVILDRVG